MPDDLQPQTIAVMFKNIDEKLDSIHAQTTKTNGRVTKNEEDITSFKEWKQFITGGIAVIVAVILPLLFLVIKSYFK